MCYKTLTAFARGKTSGARETFVIDATQPQKLPHRLIPSGSKQSNALGAPLR